MSVQPWVGLYLYGSMSPYVTIVYPKLYLEPDILIKSIMYDHIKCDFVCIIKILFNLYFTESVTASMGMCRCGRGLRPT